MNWIPIADNPPEAGEDVIYHTQTQHVGRGMVHGDPGNQFIKDKKTGDIVLIEEITHWTPYLKPF